MTEEEIKAKAADATRQMMARFDTPEFKAGLLIGGVGIGLCFSVGVHNYWTFFTLCAAWGMWTFAKAEHVENKYALQVLVRDKAVFDQLSGEGQILIVRA